MGGAGCLQYPPDVEDVNYVVETCDRRSCLNNAAAV